TRSGPSTWTARRNSSMRSSSSRAGNSPVVPAIRAPCTCGWIASIAAVYAEASTSPLSVNGTGQAVMICPVMDFLSGMGRILRLSQFLPPPTEPPDQRGSQAEHGQCQQDQGDRLGHQRGGPVDEECAPQVGLGKWAEQQTEHDRPRGEAATFE